MQPMRAPQAEKRLDTVSMTMTFSARSPRTRRATASGSPAVDELAVGLVADDEQVMLLGDVDHQVHLLRREHRTGGVAGVGAHDGAGVLVDQRLDARAVGVAVALLGSWSGRGGSVAPAGIDAAYSSWGRTAPGSGSRRRCRGCSSSSSAAPRCLPVVVRISPSSKCTPMRWHSSPGLASISSGTPGEGAYASTGYGQSSWIASKNALGVSISGWPMFR